MSHPRTPGPALIVRHTGQVFPLTAEPLTIGRQDDNTIILSDPRASAHHAVVTWREGAFYVEDLGSANGTFINERPITRPQALRHGYVLRLGDTLFDVQLPPSAGYGPELSMQAPGEEPGEGAPPRRPALPVILGVLLGGFLVICLTTALILFLLDRSRGEPAVSIQSPEEGAEIELGKAVLLQATATGARNITRLDLSVDGIIVASAKSSDPEGQSSITASQQWTFAQAGPHIVSAVAYTADDRVSSPVSRQVQVVDALSRATPGPSGMPPLTPSPGTDTPTPTATTTPTATETPTPGPTATSYPQPIIEFFRANPATIDAGECTFLEWGNVLHAAAATIDHGIGGVATPGSRQVCPATTTTYTLTASGPGGVVTASASVTVRAAQADLIVESITFTPNPPIEGLDCQVRITLRNVGTGAARPFAWRWQPGTAAPFEGTVAGGLQAGEATGVVLVWRPDNWYTDLATIAWADVDNQVAETNEENNQLQVNVSVQRGPTTVILPSQARLDGYVIGGVAAHNNNEIRAGNSPAVAGEMIYRGFLSFDVSDIPFGATIHEAQLRIYQVAIQGNPYAKLGQPLLKLVDYGPALDTEDFGGPELGTVALAAIPSPSTWYTVGTDVLAPWIGRTLDARRTRFQLRFQFSVEIDDGASIDYIQLESADNSMGSGNVPQLTITYTP